MLTELEKIVAKDMGVTEEFFESVKNIINALDIIAEIEDN